MNKATFTLAFFAMMLLVILAASTDTSSVTAQAQATATPTYYECPCWTPGDPDGQCVDCRDAEPDAPQSTIYLHMMAGEGDER